MHVVSARGVHGVHGVRGVRGLCWVCGRTLNLSKAAIKGTIPASFSTLVALT